MKIASNGIKQAIGEAKAIELKYCEGLTDTEYRHEGIRGSNEKRKSTMERKLNTSSR
ncbi:hypothetical protein I4U23_027872 [Adineta vaga]|nr:hypothetical protein I4U23_027872 [Adineta vaga]